MVDPAAVTSRIWRWRSDAALQEDTDALAVEEPLEIRVRGRAVSVTMRTPGHDDELAVGFLLSEGLIGSRADVARVDPCVRASEGNVINVFLRSGVDVDWEKLTRHVFASSSCGLCGKASIEAVHGRFPPIEGAPLRVSDAVLQALPNRLHAAQAAFGRTGGLHAAALFDGEGELRVLREDVGRHNAVDKVLGRALLDGRVPLGDCLLMVSGRASFEIMQKALAGGVAMVAAVSAPSSLAVTFARESGQTLVGFLRPGRMNVYAHRERIGFGGDLTLRCAQDGR
ncbi:MAG: formate dehydrogenase accessory sulfurtransferase FdhD [Phycisphaeraceae bacterium]